MTEKTRLLGIDYGTVRIGLAVTDRERKFASPLATYQRRDSQQDSQFFQRLLKEEDIGAIVVGMPIHTSGAKGQKALEAEKFGRWLTEQTGLPVYYYDERFTTVEAEQFLQTAGLTSRRRKARRDRVAAQILLQSFLDAGCPEETTLGPLDS